MFVVFHDYKPKVKHGCLGFQDTFSRYQCLNTLKNQFKFSTLTVSFICFLAYTIHSDNERIKTRLYNLICMVNLCKNMAIGTRNGFYTFMFCMVNHFINGRIYKRFSPIPKENYKYIIPYFINEFLKDLKIHASSRTIHSIRNRTKATS